MSEDKCMNEGCGQHNESAQTNCNWDWLYGANPKDNCDLFTTTPTTSITKDRLAELEEGQADDIWLAKIEEIGKYHDHLATTTATIAEQAKVIEEEIKSREYWQGIAREDNSRLTRLAVMVSESRIKNPLSKSLKEIQQFLAKGG